MKDSKKYRAKKIKEKFLFDLPDYGYEINRSVYRNPKTNILTIKSHFTSDKYKENYNTFVDAYRNNGILEQIRDTFHQAQANLYQEKRNLFQTLLSKLLTPVPKVCTTGNFLDVGCNTGNFIGKLPDSWNIYGVEINKEAVKLAKRYKNIKVYRSSIDEFNPKIRFDFVRVSHVIEHIENYEAFVQKINKLTNKNGYVLLYTPNTKSISYFLFNKYWSGFYEKTHIKMFNLDNLTTVCEQNGFRIVEKGTYYMGMSAGSLLLYSRIMTGTFLAKAFFLIFLLLFYPASFLINSLRLGGAQYMYLQKL